MHCTEMTINVNGHTFLKCFALIFTCFQFSSFTRKCFRVSKRGFILHIFLGWSKLISTEKQCVVLRQISKQCSTLKICSWSKAFGAKCILLPLKVRICTLSWNFWNSSPSQARFTCQNKAEIQRKRVWSIPWPLKRFCKGNWLITW